MVQEGRPAAYPVLACSLVSRRVEHAVPQVDNTVEIFLVPVLVGDHHDRLVHGLVDLPEEFEHHL